MTKRAESSDEVRSILGDALKPAVETIGFVSFSENLNDRIDATIGGAGLGIGVEAKNGDFAAPFRGPSRKLLFRRRERP